MTRSAPTCAPPPNERLCMMIVRFQLYFQKKEAHQRRSACSDALRIRILSYLGAHLLVVMSCGGLKLLDGGCVCAGRSSFAANQGAVAVKLVFDCLFAAANGSPSVPAGPSHGVLAVRRLQLAGLGFMSWMLIKGAPSSITAVAPALLQGLLRLLQIIKVPAIHRTVTFARPFLINLLGDCVHRASRQWLTLKRRLANYNRAAV